MFARGSRRRRSGTAPAEMAHPSFYELSENHVRNVNEKKKKTLGVSFTWYFERGGRMQNDGHRDQHRGRGAVTVTIVAVSHRGFVVDHWVGRMDSAVFL